MTAVANQATRKGAVPRIPRKSTDAAVDNRKIRATELAAQIVADQAEAAAAKRRVDQAKAELLALVDTLKVKSLDLVGPTGELLRVARVQAESDRLDESKLRALLGAKEWAKVTRRVLDVGLLEQKVADGTVDPVYVAQATTTVTNNPYVKVTTKGAPAAQKTAGE